MISSKSSLRLVLVSNLVPACIFCYFLLVPVQSESNIDHVRRGHRHRYSADPRLPPSPSRTPVKSSSSSTPRELVRPTIGAQVVVRSVVSDTVLGTGDAVSGSPAEELLLRALFSDASRPSLLHARPYCRALCIRRAWSKRCSARDRTRTVRPRKAMEKARRNEARRPTKSGTGPAHATRRVSSRPRIVRGNGDEVP